MGPCGRSRWFLDDQDAVYTKGSCLQALLLLKSSKYQALGIERYQLTKVRLGCLWKWSIRKKCSHCRNKVQRRRVTDFVSASGKLYSLDFAGAGMERTPSCFSQLDISYTV